MNEIRILDEILSSISVTHSLNKKELIFLNTSDVLKGKILSHCYMPVSQMKGQAKKTINNGDILFSEIRPKNKRFAYVDVKNPDDYIVSTKLMVLRNKTKDVINDYIFYFLTSDGMLDYLQMRAENRIGSFPQITFDILKPIRIRIPSPSTQEKIAAVLSTLDAKIKLNNRINVELEAMAKTLYDYWFVQFDFPISKEQAKAMGKPELTGKPYKSSGGKMVYNETLKREIPERWEVRPLISFCVNIGDGIHGTPKYVEASNYSFINGNNLKNGFIQITKETKKVSKDEYEKHYIELNEETILLSINGTIGNLAVYSGEKVMLGKSAAYINCKDNYRPYCYQYLKMKNIQQVLWSIATGSTIKNLSLDSLKMLLLPMPDSKTSELFYNLLKPIDTKRQSIFQQNQQLAQLRDWLLPMLMNGQVTVK